MFGAKVLLASLGLMLMIMSAGRVESRVFGNTASDDKSREAVYAWLKDLTKGKSGLGEPKIALVDGSVRDMFPHDRFYSIRFMRYPRAVKPPAPLKLENLIRVRSNGLVEQIGTLDALKNLVKTQLGEIRGDEQARAAVMACLRLAEEFFQDGSYVFSIPVQSVSVVRRDGHFAIKGKAVVTKGGHGEITVSLTTGDGGEVSIEGKVRPNVRLR
jgi:hypothetical protein